MVEIMLGSILNENTIDIEGRVFADKDSLFNFMTTMFYNAGYIESKSDFLKALYEREETGSTYMGDNIAVPHGKSATVKKAGAAVVRCTPFDYASGDEVEKVELCIMLAVPDSTEADSYVRLLANISRLLMNSSFRDALINSSKKSEILAVGEREFALLPKF